MRNTCLVISYFIISFTILSCKPNPPVEPSGIINNLLFLDSTIAAKKIVNDSIEHFFDYVNKLDMCIQLKDNYPDSVDRKEVLKDYKKDLQASVLNFSDAEKDFILKSFNLILDEASFDIDSIFDIPICLTKIDGKHYGDNAYYTRENCILIPKKELINPDIDLFSNVMEHELFHIYSRYHPDKKAKLYALIGYTNIGTIEHLEMNTALRQKILLNPDGINYAYSFQFKDSTNNYEAIPIVSSTKAQFDPLETAFFPYLDFDFYKVYTQANEQIIVESSADGTSLIDYTQHKEFRKKIGDNTDYIIHPDEILADNFVLLLDGPKSWEALSPRGQEILYEMKNIIFD